MARGARRRGRRTPQARSTADGPASIAVLGGARGTNEDAYVWARFAKSVLGTDNVDAQLGDGLPAEVVLGLPGATIADLDRAARHRRCSAPDLKEELPVLHLRVRRAAVELGVPVIELAPRATGLTRERTAVLRHAPGEAGTIAAAARPCARAATAPRRATVRSSARSPRSTVASGDLIVVLGRQSLAESADAVVRRPPPLAALPDVKFLSALRRGNVPRRARPRARARLPARTGELDADWLETPGVERRPAGLDAAGILDAPRPRSHHTLVLLGADLLVGLPRSRLVAPALDAAPGS